jgi:hypothetical protein
MWLQAAEGLDRQGLAWRGGSAGMKSGTSVSGPRRRPRNDTQQSSTAVASIVAIRPGILRPSHAAGEAQMPPLPGSPSFFLVGDPATASDRVWDRE